MACLSMESFVGNGALKEVLPKLLEEGWEAVETFKLMKTEDMDAVNMTQQQKDALEMRSYLHDRALLQYGDKLEASGKSLVDLLGLSTDHLSIQFGMKRGHISCFMNRKTSVAAACAVDPFLQAPHTLPSSSNASKSYRNNNIYEATMDPKLYSAVMGGKENEYKEVLMQYKDTLEQQITSNKNTVLHVAAQFGNQKCVEMILEINGETPSSLLRCLNINDETPLHVAARQGHYGIVEALICSAEKLDKEPESGGGATKEMLRAKNKDKDTALHMVVRKRNNKRVVELLTKKDEEITRLANNFEETPLFLAAERRYFDLVFVILKNCTSPAYGGPGGMTALHVAVMDRSWNTEIIENLLEKMSDLIKETDGFGWTPLHCAACYDNRSGVKCLLQKDKSMMYITTNDEDEKTALHIAATFGRVEVMEELLSHCPDCWEMVNSKGRNVLHIAVDMEEERVIKYMLEKSWIIHLINQKDIEGNTPLHLLATYINFDMELWRHPSADLEATNNNSKTPRDIRRSGEGYYASQILGGGGSKRNIACQYQEYIKLKSARKERKKEAIEERKAREEEKKPREEEEEKIREEKIRKTIETNLIVSTLIAAVTFTASFTMPGGYDNNKGAEQGMAVLIRAAAFKAFVITNTIAVICSMSSVFLYVSASLYIIDYGQHQNKQYRRHVMALFLISISVGSMMLAFITGTYAVLAHSLGIAITVCVIGSVSFVIYFAELIKYFQYSLLESFGGPCAVMSEFDD